MATAQSQSALTTNRLATVGDIAEKLDVKEHKVRYIVNSRRIEPAQRAGGLRLFDRAGVELIRKALWSMSIEGQPNGKAEHA